MISNRRPPIGRTVTFLMSVGSIRRLIWCGELGASRRWTAPPRPRRGGGRSSDRAWASSFLLLGALEVDLVDEDRPAGEVDARAGTCPAGPRTPRPAGTGSGRSAARGGSSVAWCSVPCGRFRRSVSYRPVAQSRDSRLVRLGLVGADHLDDHVPLDPQPRVLGPDDDLVLAVLRRDDGADDAAARSAPSCRA